MVAKTYLTPPEVAALLRVRVSKVLAWIRTGELRAVDVSTIPGSGRARWRISDTALQEWENRRAAKPPPTSQRRRRPTVKEYF